MTTPAICTKLSVVRIVRPVAISTTTAYVFHFLEGAAVACVTGNIDMRAIERELCLDVVIEDPQVPTDRVVAGVAAILKPTVMWILFDMT